MDTIQIGKIISAQRKERGITQEELANHLGVSKPAVSKWESGQSYPDILLLPELASYFNITVDELIGYEPQMTAGDIRKLYHRLADAFAKEPFDQVYEECEGYIKKYFSCWLLQHHMGLLLVNHSSLVKKPERVNKILERALELFLRVEKSCEDVGLAKQALALEALCHLMLMRPTEAIDILENQHYPPVSTESLLVKAYLMKGDKGKAVEYLQGYMYMNLMNMLSSAEDYFQMYADQAERMEQYYHLFIQLGDLFEVEELHSVMLIKIHLCAALVYVSQGKKEAALDALERYVELLAKSNQGNFKLHGNRIFDALDGYISNVLEETDMPRNAKLVWADLKNIVLNNPSFATLENEERFIRLKKSWSIKL